MSTGIDEVTARPVFIKNKVVKKPHPGHAKRTRKGLRDDLTGAISKIMMAREGDAEMQKPRVGFSWVVIPANFDSTKEIINESGDKEVSELARRTFGENAGDRS